MVRAEVWERELFSGCERDYPRDFRYINFMKAFAMGEKDYEVTYKILILGDSGVGKTCLIFRFIEDIFSDSYISTIGMDI